MDEAYLVGLGRYLIFERYCGSESPMCQHLERVLAIVTSMVSTARCGVMFFKLMSADGQYDREVEFRRNTSLFRPS